MIDQRPQDMPQEDKGPQVCQVMVDQPGSVLQSQIAVAFPMEVVAQVCNELKVSLKPQEVLGKFLQVCNYTMVFKPVALQGPPQIAVPGGPPPPGTRRT